MKKKNIRFKALCLAAATAVTAVSMTWSVPSSSAASNDATVQAYEQQLADYEAKRQEAEQKAQAAQNDINQVLEYKKALDDSISYTIQKMEVAEAMITELEAQIAAKQELLEETEEAMVERREAFLARMVALHEDGNASYLELLLGAEDISMFLSRVDSVNSMMSYDQKVIDDLRESKKIINESIASIEASKAAQEEVLTQLESDKAYYDIVVAESDSALQQYVSDKATYEAVSQQYLAAEEALNNELTEYLAKRQQETNKVYVGGNFMWPLTEGATYISSHFGWRDLYGVQDFHGATDIPAPTGTDIHVSNAGEVIRSEWHYSYGNYVLVDHGDGISTLYAHMSARYVSAGQTVSKGEVIGAVGNTGNSYGSHLHFEYRINGERVNPENYVPAPY